MARRRFDRRFRRPIDGDRTGSAYPKIRRILRWDDETIGKFLRQLLLRAETVEPDRIAGVQLRDAADSAILGSFVAGRADWLVTGDADLTSLRDDFPILKPSEFAVRL